MYIDHINRNRYSINAHLHEFTFDYQISFHLYHVRESRTRFESQ